MWLFRSIVQAVFQTRFSVSPRNWKNGGPLDWMMNFWALLLLVWGYRATAIDLDICFSVWVSNRISWQPH